MLTGWPIPTAASALSGFPNGHGAPIGRPLEAAPLGAQTGTPADDARRDLSVTLTAPLNSDAPPEIVFRLRDTRSAQAKSD